MISRLSELRKVGHILAFLLAGYSAQTHASYIQNEQGLVVMEAENGSLEGGADTGWDEITGSGLSSGTAIKSTGSSSWWLTDTDRSAYVYEFDITNPGKHKILLRVKNSGSAEIEYGSTKGAVYFGNSSGHEWSWHDGNQNSLLLNANFPAGRNTLKIWTRTHLAAIDKIAIIRDGYDDSAFELKTDGFGSGETKGTEPPPPPPSGGYIQNEQGLVVMEAENGSLEGGADTGWGEITGPGLSSGTAIKSTGSSSWWLTDTDRSAYVYEFDITNPGKHKILLRVKNSGSAEIEYGSTKGAVYFGNSSGHEWSWHDGNQSSLLLDAYFPVGTNTLKIWTRTHVASIDKIAIIRDGYDDSAFELKTDGFGSGETKGTEPPLPPPPPSTNEITDFTRFPGMDQYGVTFTLPDCDASDAMTISSSAQLSDIGTSSKRVFCLKPGDYTSAGTQVITSSGVNTENPKMIVLDTRDLASFDANTVIFDDSTSGSRAYLPTLEFVDSSNWVVDRMAFVDLVNQDAVILRNSQNITISRSLISGEIRGIDVNDGSHFASIQNNLFDVNYQIEQQCVALISGSTPGSRFGGGPAHIEGTKIVNNEFSNCNDAVMLLWDEVAAVVTDRQYDSAYWGNFEGTEILGNDMYVTSAIRTNCSGGFFTGSGDPGEAFPCSASENAIDIKTGSKNAQKPVRIEDNRMWGYRKGDKNLNANFNDLGTAVAIHYSASRNIEIRNNLIYDSGVGITIVASAGNILSEENIVVDTYAEPNRDFFNRFGVHGNKGYAMFYYDDPTDSNINKFARQPSRPDIPDWPTATDSIVFDKNNISRNVGLNEAEGIGSGLVRSHGAVQNTIADRDVASSPDSLSSLSRLCLQLKKSSVAGGEKKCFDHVLSGSGSPSKGSGYWNVGDWPAN